MDYGCQASRTVLLSIFIIRARMGDVVTWWHYVVASGYGWLMLMTRSVKVGDKLTTMLFPCTSIRMYNPDRVTNSVQHVPSVESQ